MIKVNEIRGRIVAKGYTQAEFAKKLGITPKTFYLKMKRGVFGSDEIKKMIDLLDIEDPMRIFFGQ
jgi:transcriptional regulator with XRE-family HTH domain